MTNKTNQINNNSPLVDDKGNVLTRRFTGKTSGFKDKQEQRFHQKALKAYAKGCTHFPFGKNVLNQTNYVEVPQEYSYRKP